MYRLPSPFQAKASHQPLSAAGGGSTTTTCSCCVVTLGIASIGTARHFARLAQLPPSADYEPEADSPDAAWQAHSEAQSSPDSDTQIAPEPEQVTKPSIPPARMAAIGSYAVGICVLVGVLLGNITNSTGIGLLAAIGTWISLFAWAYNRTQQHLDQGVIVGILSLLGLCLLTGIEMYIWFNVIG